MNALDGHLHLRAVRAADGSTALSAQSFRAPFHLSKPNWDPDAEVLHAQVVNPTAAEAQIQGGLLQGISSAMWGQTTFSSGKASSRN